MKPLRPTLTLKLTKSYKVCNLLIPGRTARIGNNAMDGTSRFIVARIFAGSSTRTGGQDLNSTVTLALAYRSATAGPPKRKKNPC